MWQAVGGILPLAIVAAASSMPILAMFVILLSPRRSESALPFLAGWVLGCLVVLTLGILAAQAVPIGRRPRSESATIGQLEILIGAALIILAVLAFLRRNRSRAGPLPAWVSKIDSFGALPAFGVGLALNLRPKALLLAAAASLVIRGQKLALQESLPVIVIYTVIATSTVWVPTVMTLLFPDRMQARLNASRNWLAQNGLLVTAVAMALVGILIMVTGFRNV